jgi:hypothetical protein
MPDALCIADLQDGRRALAYINKEAGTAQLVLVLRPDDLIPKSMRIPAAPPIPVVDLITGQVIGHFTSARDLPIPPPPPAPRITVDDLLQRGAQLQPNETVSPEDQILRDIENLRGGDPEAPAIH